MDNRTIYHHKCLMCGTHFVTHAKNSMFCSSACSGLSRRKRVTKICAFCRREFDVWVSQEYRIYCSNFCFHASRKHGDEKRFAMEEALLAIDNLKKQEYTESKMVRRCSGCGKVFRSRDNFCSRCGTKYVPPKEE